MVKLLLSKNADYELEKNLTQSSIDIANDLGYSNINKLVKNGTKVNCRNKKGHIPLHNASKSQYLMIGNFLWMLILIQSIIRFQQATLLYILLLKMTMLNVLNNLLIEDQ